MGLCLKADLKDPEPLASNRGWSDTLDWVKDLPEGEFLEVRNLAAYGWSQEPDELHDELTRALDEHEPGDVDTRSTVENLAALVGGWQDAEVICVTNGLGE